MTELRKNQVIAILPDASRDALAALLQRETLAQWQKLRDENEPIRRVYFPINGVISIVALTEDGTIAEAYTAGRDGIAGAEIILGAGRLIHRSMCQVPGVVYWMQARDFLAMAEKDQDFERAVHLYLHCMVGLAGRAAACNLLHGLAERCARWLLLTQDRVGSDSFELTHDILATMLGVRRPAVTIAAGTLPKRV